MNAFSPQWDQWTARAEAVDIAAVAQRLQPKLKRAGADLLGPCPAGCASTDGFVVTPREHIFLCRPSGVSGNAIVMVRHSLSCGFAEALEFITGESRPDRSRDETEEERQRREAARARQQADAEARARRQDAADANKRDRDDEAIASIIERAVPIAGTHAEAYLRARGLRPPKRLTGDLRFCNVPYYGFEHEASKEVAFLATLPAMIAVIRDVDGAMIGVHQTFLDPVEPRKWRPLGDAHRNKAKKIRGRAKGGMIRLGMLGECLVIGEGIETALAHYALGRSPEDASLASGISLGNIAGGAAGSIPHPTVKGPDGKPTAVRNGVPDMDKPGVILPACVREVILLGDGDSEPLATRGAMLTAGRRFRNEGRTVALDEAPRGRDWNDELQAHLADIARGQAA